MGLQQPRIGRSNELAVESVRPKGREAEATGWAASFEGYRRVLSFGVPLAHASNESPPRLTGLATSCSRCARASAGSGQDFKVKTTNPSPAWTRPLRALGGLATPTEPVERHRAAGQVI